MESNSVESKIKERPILFRDELVRAILAGEKTVTRRLMKPQMEFGTRYSYEDTYYRSTPASWFWKHHSDVSDTTGPFRLFNEWCPYGRVGERLWVREAFIASTGVGGYAPHVNPNIDPFGETIDVIYRADDGPNERTAGPWSSPIHMPRPASRILLEITDVRCERVNEITDDEIRAEGVADRAEFVSKWNSIYPENKYESNPWVWVIQFKRVPND